MRFISLALLVVACGSSTPAPVTPSTPPQGAVDACAGDPWLAQILGEEPEMSVMMRVDVMKKSRIYGPAFVDRDHVEMDHIGDLQDVRSTSAETYQWEGPPNENSSSGHDTSRVTVLRKAFGDPLSIKGGSEAMYGAPSTLASGAMEYPPTAANSGATFGPRGGHTIFTFSDGTWVEVDQWMAQRFRASFAASGPPPLPPSDPDVGWEICAKPKASEAIASGVWGTPPTRGVLRFYGGRDADAELLYRFATPELARRADAEQRNRCAQGLPHTNDKGIFSLRPPCEALPVGDGPFLRYSMRFPGLAGLK